MKLRKDITVLLAEDHRIVREGFRQMLSEMEGIEVVGEAENGGEALSLAGELGPDLVLMDIAMPGMKGIDAARRIAAACGGTKVIILSAHIESIYVRGAKQSGASGFLSKHCSMGDLHQAILRVTAGETVFPLQGSDAPRVRLQALTPREIEVLRMIAGGKSNKQSAGDLGISIKTVEKHRGHLMDKLGIHDTAGLTRYAVGMGLLDGAD